MRNPILQKPVLSPFVALSFIAISATGILLFFHIKNGPIIVIHEWFGWAFVAAGLIHLLLNIKQFFAYLKLKSGWASIAVALVLTVALTVIGLNHRGGPDRNRPAGTPPAAQQK